MSNFENTFCFNLYLKIQKKIQLLKAGNIDESEYDKIVEIHQRALRRNFSERHIYR